MFGSSFTMRLVSLILILSELLDTTKPSGAPGTNKTNLSTGRSLLADS